MEQSRTISAMKNHIDKLEAKLGCLQQDNSSSNAQCSPEGSAVSIERKKGEKVQSSLKNHKKKRKNEAKLAVKSKACEEWKTKHRQVKDVSSESGEDIFVYIENEDDPLKSTAHDEASGRSELKEDLEVKNDDCKKGARDLETIVDEETSTIPHLEPSTEAEDGNRNREYHSTEEADNVGGYGAAVGDKTEVSNIGLVEQSVCEFKSENISHVVDDGLQHRNSSVESAFKSHGIASSENSVDKKEHDILNDPFATQAEDNNDVANGEVSNSECGSHIDEEAPQCTAKADALAKDDSFTSDDKFVLEEANVELRERIAELEEQLWLAAEERRNMQGILELQKEKALKNLAFKFEDINRKTLREFKGIFEYRLQELNEEKLKLQDKLENYKCIQCCQEQACKECDKLKTMLVGSEAKIHQLMDENNTLKHRCWNLSGDLGKVKKVIGSIAVCDEVALVDASSQTEEQGAEKSEIATQCEKSQETSLSDLHDGIKDIATRVSTISSHLLTEQRKWSQGEEFFAEIDANRSESSNNESGIESLRLSPTKSRTDSELEDEGNATFSGNSERNEASFFVEEPKQFASSIDEVDSGVFANDVTLLSEHDIERHLMKIHAKYLKISNELENFATMKLNLKNDNYEDNTDGSEVKLDPEIQKLVDDVNKKYDEYFKSKVVF